jgi:hypothetical protein
MGKRKQLKGAKKKNRIRPKKHSGKNQKPAAKNDDQEE